MLTRPRLGTRRGPRRILIFPEKRVLLSSAVAGAGSLTAIKLSYGSGFNQRNPGGGCIRRPRVFHPVCGLPKPKGHKRVCTHRITIQNPRAPSKGRGMSRKLATTIKDSAVPSKYKRVLEAYAAFANNDGSNCYPSQAKLGDKAGTSVDTIQRITPELVASGILKRAEKHTCRYENCNKGATHYAGHQGKYTLVYEIQLDMLQNAGRY